MKDSLENADIQRTAIESEANYKYEKKLLVEKAKEEQRQAVADEEKEKTLVIIVAISVGFVLVVIFLIVVFKRLRVTREQKVEIEKQKANVEEARLSLENKNRTITDSIEYAKRIQTAILPSEALMNELWPNAFVYYQPKDIVAGDFYWVAKVEDTTFIAAADCTGHGVPGAMVSVVCNNALNRSVREYGMKSPGEILDKAREIIIAEFSKSSENVQDGMDIAMAAIQGNNLTFAGAHNPLWLIRGNELIEFKGDKQPIGKYYRNEKYTEHQITLIAGDSIYLFSDGYIDQFGGEKGKKLKSGGFKRLIQDIAKEPFHSQNSELSTYFNQWRGDHEQLDDVCVIGLKIS